MKRFYIEQTILNKVTQTTERRLIGKSQHLMKKELKQGDDSFKVFIDRTAQSFYSDKYSYTSSGYCKRAIEALKKHFQHGCVYEIEYRIVCLEGEE